MQDAFLTTSGAQIRFGDQIDRLKVEHILQSDRSVWRVVGAWPYLAVDQKRLDSRLAGLSRFPVFSSAVLMQNASPKDVAGRILSALAGGGTSAGFDQTSRIRVEGKANPKANHLFEFNAPFIVGTTPWCAEGARVIFVDGSDQYQHSLGELVVDDGPSHPRSPHFDFAPLIDLRNRYNSEFLQRPADGRMCRFLRWLPGVERNQLRIWLSGIPFAKKLVASPHFLSSDLKVLSTLLDETFEQNALSLAAATAYHDSIASGLTSDDYEAPVLSRYDRPTHDASGTPRIEVSYALMHYEQALHCFDAQKRPERAGEPDEAFRNGVYCVVAVAACVEAIANKLVYIQTGVHPDHKNKNQPLVKINQAANLICQSRSLVYVPLAIGDPVFDTLDKVRVARNGFMHAKELATDVDPSTRSSSAMSSVNEAACRNYLKCLREGIERVYAQLPHLAPPIVTNPNHTWLGDIEVP